MTDSLPDNASRRPAVGDVVAGKYRLERMIGEGGMGTVYAARHLLTEKRCAVKCIRPERTDPSVHARFEQEARAAGRVHHPNVVAVYDIGEHHGAAFLVMELLEGSSLRARIEGNTLALDEALDLISQAARGVAAAHEAGVVHRDLKPDNLFVTLGPRREPIVKVLDFGISKVEHDAHALETRSGALIGTPLYMAPERLFGEPSDARADVYSLGVILYECLTGKLPHFAENAAALGRRFAERTPVTPPSALRSDVPELVDDVIMHALAQSAAERPAGAQQWAETLEEVRALLRDGERSSPVPIRKPAAPNLAFMTTVDSTTGSGKKNAPTRAASAQASIASTKSPDGQLVPQARRMRSTWLALGTALLLLVVWWLVSGTREDAARAPKPAPSVRTRVTIEPAPKATASPTPKPDSLQVPAAGDEPSQVAVDEPRPPSPPIDVAPRSTTLRNPAKHDSSAKREPRGAGSPADTTPPSGTPEVGRSKARFGPKDFY